MNMCILSAIAPTFNRQHVGRALRQLKLAAEADKREITALNKAAVFLDSALWQFDGSTLKIESATQVGRVRYEVRAGACQCPASSAHRHCWHAAAWRLLVTADQLARTPRPVRTLVEAQAAVDELYA